VKRLAVSLAIAAAMICLLAIEERSGILRVGDPAPDFTTTLSSGLPWTLSDFAGKQNVVLFFYPKDRSPGCTRQVCAYRDSIEAITGLDAVVLGISRDTEASHELFIAERSLPFPLASDRDGRLSTLYGTGRLWGLLPLAKRVTYVIDRRGVIRAVIHAEFNIDRHATDVLQALRSL
jgi:thioredoxin-dependent peroxiredoxin